MSKETYKVDDFILIPIPNESSEKEVLRIVQIKDNKVIVNNRSISGKLEFDFGEIEKYNPPEPAITKILNKSKWLVIEDCNDGIAHIENVFVVMADTEEEALIKAQAKATGKKLDAYNLAELENWQYFW